MAKAKSSKAVSTARASKSKPSLSNSLGDRFFRWRYARPALFAMVFAIVGVGTLLLSYAAVPTGPIVNKRSGKCLENFYNRQLNTNFISTYKCDSNNVAQKWTIASDGSIRTAQNFCLDGTNARQGTERVWLWECNSGSAQKWQVQSNGTIKNSLSGFCLEALTTTTFLGGPNIITRACDATNTSQVWTVPSSVIPVPTPPPTNPPTSTTPTGSVDVKTSCRNSTTTANGTQVRTTFPNNANTGPQVGGYSEVKLPKPGSSPNWTISGTKLTITKDGTVLNAVYHNGIIEVNANNVTIKNSIICGVGTTIVRSNGQNLVIENSILRGERDGGSINAKTGEPCAATVGYGNYTVRRTEMSGCADGAKLANRVEITDSWFHDNYTNRGVGGVAGGGTHNDTVQKNDDTPLSSLVFRGNAAYQDACTSNRHFQLKSKTGQSMQSLVIENNFFYGIRVVMMDGFTAQQGVFRNNVLAGTAARGPFATGLLYAGSGINTLGRQGNVYESRQAADGNPSGYTCAAS